MAKKAAFSPSKRAEAAASCACSNFRKAARAITQLYDHALQPSGLRSTQLILLLEIAVAESITVSRLARRLVMDSSTVTRNLKPLTNHGLINQIENKHKRGQAYALTRKGDEALQDAMPLWEKAQDLIVSGFDEKHWSALLDNLSEITKLARGMTQI